MIDVCITTYRNTEKLKICLSSVLERTKYIDYNIYLLCNDPNDEVKKTVHDSMFVDGIQFTDRIIPIFNDNNNGSFSSNNNEAATEGTGEYILFLNDDTCAIKDDWLYKMVKILESDNKIGVVGSLLLYPDKKTIQHCGVFFSHRTNNLPFHMFYKQPIANVFNFVSQYRYYQAITGACMLARRKDFENVGGFSTEYYYTFEDIDLCIRIKDKLKKACVYCPESILVHDEGVSKTQPKLKDNIEAFRKNCTGKYFNDYEFYIQDPKFMIYKPKQEHK